MASVNQVSFFLQHVYDVMHLHDTMVCQANMLKKNHACLQDFEDQTCDATEALQKYRLYHGEAKKKEQLLQSELEEAQS